MECCGQKRSTCFCADCGKLLQSHSLITLLRHCETQARNQRATVERKRKLGARVASWERAAEKWECWANAIADTFGE